MLLSPQRGDASVKGLTLGCKSTTPKPGRHWKKEEEAGAGGRSEQWNDIGWGSWINDTEK